MNCCAVSSLSTSPYPQPSSTTCHPPPPFLHLFFRSPPTFVAAVAFPYDLAVASLSLVVGSPPSAPRDLPTRAACMVHGAWCMFTAINKCDEAMMLQKRSKDVGEKLEPTHAANRLTTDNWSRRTQPIGSRLITALVLL